MADERTNAQPILSRTSLIREVYRTLINNGRSYAAFTDVERLLVTSLKDKGEILDPMSGYGLLARFCSENGVSSYCVEFNVPQYYWQFIQLPNLTEFFLGSLELMLKWRSEWPRASTRASVCDNWFHEESNRLLTQLFQLSRKAVAATFPPFIDIDHAALAQMIPFVGRLSSSVPGNISTFTKPGGLCVYTGWQDDFNNYLLALSSRLDENRRCHSVSKHELHLGDARTFSFPAKRFQAMVTSPPYPNRMDFSSMFKPEYAFLMWLIQQGIIHLDLAPERIIGSAFVSQKIHRKPTSSAVVGFLERVAGLKLSSGAAYDDKVYYVPYFSNYFADLEAAYSNISSSLADEFEGYIVVVNNTHRGVVVPVAQAIVEIWQNLGFEAEVFDSNETFHIGTKNPRSRGIRARHTEYVIRVARRC
ncbi:MAG: hypothetical protein ABFD46_08410 [Armatimonadota bacterium]